MKWTIIILNLLAAVFFFLLGSLAISIHHAHSYSMYQEFISVGAVDEQKLATIPRLPSQPPGAHYDLLARLRQIGDAESWLNNISVLAAAACVANAVLIFFLFRKRETTQAANAMTLHDG
jgi:hypothetical protein